MKKSILILFILSQFLIFGQDELKSELIMKSESFSDHPELTDLMKFEGISYYKVSFSHKDLADKSYLFTVKEVWNGKVTNTDTIVNSKDAPFKSMQQVNDTIFNLRVMSKLTDDSQLKMSFKLPGFTTVINFTATNSQDYRLRNVADNSATKLRYGKSFYLFAYILPYKKENRKYYCAVEDSGSNIESWGETFGIEHYLIFEMLFER